MTINIGRKSKIAQGVTPASRNLLAKSDQLAKNVKSCNTPVRIGTVAITSK